LIEIFKLGWLLTAILILNLLFVFAFWLNELLGILVILSIFKLKNVTQIFKEKRVFRELLFAHKKQKLCVTWNTFGKYSLDFGIERCK
jgi:hypothetical protein